jgi:hypothetical protein
MVTPFSDITASPFISRMLCSSVSAKLIEGYGYRFLHQKMLQTFITRASFEGRTDVTTWSSGAYLIRIETVRLLTKCRYCPSISALIIDVDALFMAVSNKKNVAVFLDFEAMPMTPVSSRRCQLRMTEDSTAKPKIDGSILFVRRNQPESGAVQCNTSRGIRRVAITENASLSGRTLNKIIFYVLS